MKGVTFLVWEPPFFGSGPESGHGASESGVRSVGEGGGGFAIRV